MTILGVSAYYHDSAIATIKNSKITSAVKEEIFTGNLHDSSFPKNAIHWALSPQETPDEIVFYEENTFARFKQDLKKYYKKDPVLVGHHESHAMSSIITKPDWQDCAVLVCDYVGGKYATSLGIWKNNTFTWLKRFEHPNSLGLLISSVTRFIGYNSLSDEYIIQQASQLGNDCWVDFIKRYYIDYDESDYWLKKDLRRGIGYGPLDYNIAASTQKIVETILLNLVHWLFKETNLPRLAISGGVFNNSYLTSAVANYSSFTDVAISPTPGEAGCALGAAAIIDKPIYKTPFLGPNSEYYFNSEDIANKLLNGHVVPIINGPLEFSDKPIGSRAYLAIPTKENISYLQTILAKDSWETLPIVCREDDKNLLFKQEANKSNSFKSYVLYASNLNYPSFSTMFETQVIKLSSNPYLYKILNITAQYGYPALILESLSDIGRPLVKDKDAYSKQ